VLEDGDLSMCFFKVKALFSVSLPLDAGNSFFMRVKVK